MRTYHMSCNFTPTPDNACPLNRPSCGDLTTPHAPNCGSHATLKKRLSERW